MKFPKRLYAICTVTLALLLLAVTGYLIPESRQDVPTRVLLNNKGGNVIFTHAKHAEDYGLACKDCHHDNMPSPQRSIACGECHPASFDKNYLKDHMNMFGDSSACITCHHVEYTGSTFHHDEHLKNTGDDCQLCHHNSDIEPEPMACSSCHEEVGDKKIPSLAEAAHTRCTQCHSDMFEQRLQGCAHCHEPLKMENYSGAYTKCSACHNEKSETLIMTRMDAYHAQCMKCHRELKKGPYGQDDCFLCHIR